MAYNLVKFMRPKKIFFALAGLVLIILAYRNFSPVKKVNPQTAKSAVPYDYSIKTEYDRPIKILRVIDGDTVEFINGDRLRYIGIDTPEEVDPRKPVQCFALEAAAANKALVEGKMITFHKDVSARDKYGRWLGFVYLEDGTFVNLKLVEEGFAFAYKYKPDISKSVEFKEAEAKARGAGFGLWSACAIQTGPGGREETNPLH